jgi:hypothetical protein
MTEHGFGNSFESFFTDSDLNLVVLIVSYRFFDLYDLSPVKLNNSGGYNMSPVVPHGGHTQLDAQSSDSPEISITLKLLKFEL